MTQEKTFIRLKTKLIMFMNHFDNKKKGTKRNHNKRQLDKQRLKIRKAGMNSLVQYRYSVDNTWISTHSANCRKFH